jgi:hypothetical protein
MKDQPSNYTTTARLSFIPQVSTYIRGPVMSFHAFPALQIIIL